MFAYLKTRFVKVNIPEEEKISRVPVTLGQIPVVSRGGGNSFVDGLSSPSQPSQTFINSQTLVGKASYVTVINQKEKIISFIVEFFLQRFFQRI